MSFSDVAAFRPECRPMADVIFLLDGSDSIADNEFEQQKEFIRRFVEMSDVGPDNVRVGVAVVSSSIGDVLPLSMNMTRQYLLSALTTISQPQEGSRTDIGLVEMEQLFSSQGRLVTREWGNRNACSPSADKVWGCYGQGE